MWVHFRYGLLLCQLGTHDPLFPERRFPELPGRTDNSPDGTLTRKYKQLLLRTDSHRFFSPDLKKKLVAVPNFTE